MKLTNSIFAAAALVLASVSSLAGAQTAPTVEPGTSVYGPEGNPVGTIESVADGIATLNTGTNLVGLPLDRFGRNVEGQTTIAVTKTQLDEMMANAAAEAAAKLAEALVAGSPVVDVNGVALGSVASVEGDTVTVETEWGSFALKPENFLVSDAGLTAQVLLDQVKAALGA